MIKKILYIFVLTLLFTGCATEQNTTTTHTVIQENDQLTNTEKDIQPGITEIRRFFKNTETAYILVYKIDPQQFRFSLEENSTNPQTIAGWRDTYPESTAIINAAYFNEDYSPTGFVITDGNEAGKNTFDYNRSGMITLSPNVDIINTAEDGAFIEKNTTDAFQSFPFLITNGRTAISTDSAKTARRSFMGKDTDGFIYFGVIPDYFVSLKEASEYISQMNISWQEVINLDGGTSTGISVKNTQTINSYTSIPSVIIVDVF